MTRNFTRITIVALAFSSIAAAVPTATACSLHRHAPAAAPKQTAAKVSAIPDIKVVTQDGQQVNFYSDLIKGKVVAVNFVYTTCTTVCPPMGALFGNLLKQNEGRVGKDVHLVSVSIDPSVDTPERLKSWAHKFGGRPGWTLVTGDKAEITKLLKAMNVYVPNFGDHQPLTLIGNDATGEWKRTYGFTSAAKMTAMIDQVRKGRV